MKKAIQVHGLVKKYKDGFSLGPIDLEIPSGMIVGLIGENGAGKTTFIKSILGIIRPDQGDVRLLNKDIKTDDNSAKEEIGVVLDDMFFPEVLTAREIDVTMRGVFSSWDSQLFYQYLKEFDLPTNQPLKSLSKGMRKKLEIITAISHQPKLLILDEPTSGLDPVVRNEILDLFLKFIQDEDHTILLSTHITTDLEHVADKIIFFVQGQKILDYDKDYIIDNYGMLKCDIEDFDKIAKEDIVRYKKNKYNYEILVTDKVSMAKKYPEFVLDRITLEDLMVLMIKGEE